MRCCAVCQADATVFCAQDAAFLCGPCNVSIHSANILAASHKVVTLGSDQALPPQAQEHDDAHSQASATPLLVKEEQSDAFPNDSSEGVVPQMDGASLLDSASLGDLAPAAWDKDFDMFDLDNGWLDKLDVSFPEFQFQDVFPQEDALVPCVSTAFAANEEPHSAAFDGAVPTSFVDCDFSPEDEFELPSAKRSKAKLEVEDFEWDQLVVPSLAVPTSLPEGALSAAPQHAPTYQMPAPIVKVSPAQAALNRATRVALHREKKKSRTFQKTIRYASRKAYAEVRPRIKGRFATKEEVVAYKAAQAKGEVGSIEEWAAVVPC